MQQTIQQLTQALLQAAEANNNNNCGAGDLHRNFRNLNPPRFSGTTDLDEAENWLKEIERRVLNATVVEVAFWLPPLGSTSACAPRVAHEVRLLTSGMGRRRPNLSRQGRNGKVRRDPNRCAIFKHAGRTELSQALLDQGRSCCGSVGQFGISAEFSSRFRREDVARSGGNAAPCMDCAFFVKLDLTSVTARLRGGGTVVFVFQWWYLVVVGGEVEILCLGDQLLRWCAYEACGLGFTVIEWSNGAVVSSSFRDLQQLS
ncbi:hypothetical protein Taro_047847 [Colocasia esculenta]|uniref:Uncharacterized protein n=1 Tax=Colocasia esculenta TaxID=4460 RepID=A0A843X815_COLES|nr:hypothetical protein [Colocasia esculenta]